MWTKPSLENLIAKAEEYGIVISDKTDLENPDYVGNGYKLEYLNGSRFGELIASGLKSGRLIKKGFKFAGLKKGYIITLVILLVLVLIAVILGILGNCSGSTPEKSVIKSAPAPAPVVVKTDSMPTFNVFFSQNKSFITSTQIASVDSIATFLNDHPSAKVHIKGYASEEGSNEINDPLSVARANAVKDTLVNKYEIDASRITTEGCGVGYLFDEAWRNRVAVSTLSE